jgi:hypothetical protein
MDDSSFLLPKNALPPISFLPPNGRLEWLACDSHEDYLKHGGHPVYGAKDVEYCFNSLGYRCPEFETKADLRIIAIGCSYVMGVGLPQPALFHELFAERLRAATSQSVVLWNLGLAGISNDYITRMLYLAVPYLDPHIVLINFTHANRREYVSIQGRWMQYTVGYVPPDRVGREIHKHFEALSSPFDDDLNLFRNYKAIESLLTHRFWLFSAINRSDFNRINSHAEFERYVGPLHEVDKARDWAHPGPKSHEALAECYWTHFCALNGVHTFSEPDATVEEARGSVGR